MLGAIPAIYRQKDSGNLNKISFSPFRHPWPMVASGRESGCESVDETAGRRDCLKG